MAAFATRLFTPVSLILNRTGAAAVTSNSANVTKPLFSRVAPAMARHSAKPAMAPGGGAMLKNLAVASVVQMVMAPFGPIGNALGFVLSTMISGCPQRLLPEASRFGLKAGLWKNLGAIFAPSTWSGNLAMWVIPSFLLSKVFGGEDKALAQQQQGQAQQAGQAAQWAATLPAQTVQASRGAALTQEQVLAKAQKSLLGAQGLLQDTMLMPGQTMAGQALPSMPHAPNAQSMHAFAPAMMPTYA